MGKTFYRIENQYAAQGWYGRKFLTDADVKFEWFDDRDHCVAQAMIQDNTEAADARKGQIRLRVRVVDHLGAVVWKGEGVQ